MEREKDNIIIITDGDEPVPETEEAATDDLENDNIDDDTEEQALLELSYTDITDTADTTDETEKIDDTEETDKPQSKIPPRFVIISAAVSAAVISRSRRLRILSRKVTVRLSTVLTRSAKVTKHTFPRQRNTMTRSPRTGS